VINVEIESNDEGDDEIQNISNVDIRGEKTSKRRKTNLLLGGNGFKEQSNSKAKNENICLIQSDDGSFQKKSLRSHSLQDKASKKNNKDIQRNRNESTKTLLNTSKEKMNNCVGKRSVGKETKKVATP